MSKNTLESILSQYEKNTENTSKGPKISNEERLKKYFTEKLQKGVKNATRIFRYPTECIPPTTIHIGSNAIHQS